MGVLTLARARENTTATALLFRWRSGIHPLEEREVKTIDREVDQLKQSEAFSPFVSEKECGIKCVCCGGSQVNLGSNLSSTTDWLINLGHIIL